MPPPPPQPPPPPRAARREVGREGGSERAGEDGAGAAARGRAAGGTREDGASGDPEEVHPEGPGHEESGPQWGGQLRPGLHGECPFSPAPRVAGRRAPLASPHLSRPLGAASALCAVRGQARGARPAAGAVGWRARGRRGPSRPSASPFRGPGCARPAGPGAEGAAAGPCALRPRHPPATTYCLPGRAAATGVRARLPTPAFPACPSGEGRGELSGLRPAERLGVGGERGCRAFTRWAPVLMPASVRVDGRTSPCPSSRL